MSSVNSCYSDRSIYLPLHGAGVLGMSSVCLSMGSTVSCVFLFSITVGIGIEEHSCGLM